MITSDVLKTQTSEESSNNYCGRDGFYRILSLGAGELRASDDGIQVKRTRIMSSEKYENKIAPSRKIATTKFFSAVVNLQSL